MLFGVWVCVVLRLSWVTGGLMVDFLLGLYFCLDKLCVCLCGLVRLLFLLIWCCLLGWFVCVFWALVLFTFVGLFVRHFTCVAMVWVWVFKLC